MDDSSFALPQFVDLKIKNISTFPQDLHISFEEGINVIFGGNYSGKTTIVNSIRFGVFGLSWGHALEGVERRYFSSRIREIQRKSLDISTFYRIKSMNLDVHRTIFSSGATEIEAQISETSGESLSRSVNNINREKQYYVVLQKFMGHIAEERLKFVPNLIFAEEDRQCILWKQNLEEFVLSLLISPSSAKNLRRIESQLLQTEKELKRFQQNNERMNRRILEKENIQSFLQRSLEEIETTKIRKHIKEYDDIRSKLKELTSEIDQLNNEFQSRLEERSSLLLQLNENQRAFRDLELRSEEIRGKWLKAVLNPKDPEEFHLSRYLYYRKECPYCLTDLSDEIRNRIETKKCLLCGKGSLVEYRGDIEEIKRQLSSLDENKKKLEQSSREIQENLHEVDKEIEKLNKSKSTKTTRRSRLMKRLNELKNVEEQMHKKEVISKELEEVTREIDHNKKSIAQNNENIEKINVEMDELRQVHDSAKMAMKTEIDSLMSKIRERFSTFVDLATNNEASGTISEDFVPVLNGRQIYHQKFASQFETAIMDYAFRVALLSVIGEKTKSHPSLIIETPDEVTDESYIPHLAKALANFSSNLSIIVTTVSTEMMKQLLNSYEPDDRKKRLINLVSEGTLTQRRFYQIPLNEYLRVRE